MNFLYIRRISLEISHFRGLLYLKVKCCSQDDCASHISDYMISELHWLPILARVRYKVLLRNICVSSCLNRHLPASLVRCALLIVVIFLHHGPVLLYPRIGPLLWWVLHSGMTPPALWNVMLQGILSASLRSLTTFTSLSL